MGEKFTIGDAYLFTLLNRCQRTGLEIARWPVLKDCHARVAARPKVQEALKVGAGEVSSR